MKKTNPNLNLNEYEEYLVTSDEMRRFDAYTSESLGVPAIVLMERAAQCACDVITDDRKDEISALIICGYGNNGGDGLALARLLYQKGTDVRPVLVGNPEKASELNKKEQEICANYGIEVIKTDAQGCTGLIESDENHCDIIIDALFGTGLSRPLEGDYASLTCAVNSCGSYVYALDIPSGLYADGGGYGNPCIKADKTITFGFNKLGIMTCPGASFAGTVIRCDIGIDLFSIDGEEPVFKRILSREGVKWPVRDMSANKGTFGKLLVIAGSIDVFGAAYMAARAAFAMGVGMVKIVTHENNRHSLQTALPEAMYSFYDDETDDDTLKDMLGPDFAWADAVLIGPGIGREDVSDKLLRSVLFDTDKPYLADADAIRIIADKPEYADRIRNDASRRAVFTPHMGEFASLMHTDTADAKEHAATLVRRCVDDLGISLICKDARSYIASFDHRDIYINTSGNDGMATAGSGDVLAGMCAVLMIQTHDTHTACAWAAYLHRSAGDDAALRCGHVGMTASDIIDSIQRIL